MRFMRDHFEGTPLDMTQDIGAGPYKLPYRWRPLTWKADEESDVEYFNERAVSTQQTGFSFVAQARSWLPDPIGGVQWWGVDDTYSTVYFPVYCGVTGVPKAFAVGTGDFHNVTWESAFWVFNAVSNYAYLRYNDMIKDIRVEQGKLEAKFMADVPEVDLAAADLYKRSPRLAKDYLTEYTVAAGDMVVERWRELHKQLLYKYLDGNVKDEKGNVTHPGYPESWYAKIAAATGDHLRLRKLEAEKQAELAKKEEARKMQESLLTLLEARNIPVDEETRAKILETEDPAQLKKWLVRAATIESTGDLFAKN